MSVMYKAFFKRFLDVILSLAAFPFWCIVLIVVGFMIYGEDKGPVFYTAPRLGKDGSVFKMYKFRSMKVNSPDFRNMDGSTYNAREDPRLTKTGRVIRNTSLDETAQILNVLKGNMSVVGPRPDLPEHLNLYNHNEKRKLEVKPGVTGLNQAYWRNAVPWRKRIQNDIYYIDHLTFLLDAKIFFSTIVHVLKREAVYITENKNYPIEDGEIEVREFHQ